MAGRPRTATGALRKCIKASYGNWLLVHLPSDRWACVWEQVLGIEDTCELILNGTWFHDKNPDAPTRAEALKLIVKGIEREIRNTSDPHAFDTHQPALQRARAALKRHSALQRSPQTGQHPA